jgi:hypothetical protein
MIMTLVCVREMRMRMVQQRMRVNLHTSRARRHRKVMSVLVMRLALMLAPVRQRLAAVFRGYKRGHKWRISQFARLVSQPLLAAFPSC